MNNDFETINILAQSDLTEYAEIDLGKLLTKKPNEYGKIQLKIQKLEKQIEALEEKASEKLEAIINKHREDFFKKMEELTAGVDGYDVNVIASKIEAGKRDIPYEHAIIYRENIRLMFKQFSIMLAHPGKDEQGHYILNEQIQKAAKQYIVINQIIDEAGPVHQ